VWGAQKNGNIFYASGPTGRWSRIHGSLKQLAAVGGTSLSLLPGSKIALKGSRWGRYCSDEGWRIRCNRYHAYKFESFKVYDAGSGLVALRGSKTQQFCGEDIHKPKTRRRRYDYRRRRRTWSRRRWSRRRWSRRRWARRRARRAEEQKKSRRTERHLGEAAHRGGMPVIKCNRRRKKFKPMEKFQVLDLGAGKIALQPGGSKKYCADQGNNVMCSSPVIGRWETFQVHCLSVTGCYY